MQTYAVAAGGDDWRKGVAHGSAEFQLEIKIGLQLPFTYAWLHMAQDAFDSQTCQTDSLPDSSDLFRRLHTPHIVDDRGDVFHRQIGVSRDNSFCQVVFRISRGIQFPLVEIHAEDFEAVAGEQTSQLPVQLVKIMGLIQTSLLLQFLCGGHFSVVQLQIGVGPCKEQLL